MEFAGGTYISQVIASSVEEARTEWGRKMNWQTVAELNTPLDSILEEIAEDVPAPIDEVTNVWCLFLLFGDESALVNIVQTVVD